MGCSQICEQPILLLITHLLSPIKKIKGAPKESTLYCLRPEGRRVLLDNYEWLISSYGVALSNEQAKNLASVVRRD